MDTWIKIAHFCNAVPDSEMKPPGKYRPQDAPARDWHEIEAWYRELVEDGLKYEPMLELVRHINATELKNRIFAYTSMHKLVIGIYDRIEWNREALHIEFSTRNQKWFFKYHAKPFEPIEFERTYSKEQGLGKFQKIIEALKW